MARCHRVSSVSACRSCNGPRTEPGAFATATCPPLCSDGSHFSPVSTRGFEDDVTSRASSLFEEIDADGNGFICYKELNKKLRAGNAMALAEELRNGAAGRIDTKAQNSIALRNQDGEAPAEVTENELAANGGPGTSVSAPASPPLDESGDGEPVPTGDRLSGIAAAGGIYPLVGLVTTGSLMGKERAAGALWHLSVDAYNRVMIAKAGGIAPLVQLLDDGTLQAHIHVAEALARLAKNNPDHQAQIAKKVVGLLGLQHRPGAQQRAAHILWELAHNDPGAPIIVVNAGAISPLVMLLSTGVNEAKREAAGALSTLALNNPSNQLAIATGLVALLGSGSAEAQEHVTLLLLTLASDADNRVAVAKAGAVQRLIMQVRHATSLKAQELAAAALSHLTGDSDENVHTIQKEGGIEPLVGLLNSENIEAKAHAAAVLSDITRVFRDEVTSEGAIDALVDLLATGETSDIRAEAAGALWSLAGGDPHTQAKVARAGAIRPLVALLADPEMRTRRKAAGALTSLAIGSLANQDAITRSNGVKPLVQLLDAKYDSEVQLYTAGALAELARDHPKNQAAIAKEGSIKPLVHILEGNDSPHVVGAKEEAAGALWMLSSRNFPNQVAIAAAGGIPPLVALLDVDSLRAQEQAAGALSSIALDNMPNKVSIATMLVGTLSPSDQVASAKAARAISRVARAHPSNQEALASAGCIQILAGLLHDSRNKKPQLVASMQKELASALWSMSADNPENQTAIAEAGSISILIELLRLKTEGGSPEVHGDAAGALWSLAADANNRKIVADAGGIVALVGLLRHGNQGAQETSAGAVHSLALRSQNRVAISDAGGIPQLVHLFEVGSPEAQDQAAGALKELVTNNSVNQSAVARELVAMLSGKSSSEAQEQVTKLLRNLALDPDNRASIAQAGAIPQLARQLRDGMPGGQEMAASALSQIALKSAGHRVQVTQELVVLLGSPTPAVRGRAAEALRDMNAEAGADSRMSIAMAGGIDRFVSLLKDGSVEAQEYALSSLWNATDMASKVSIAEARCANHIIATLVAGKLHQVAQEHATAVLCGLTSVVAGISSSLCASNKADIVSSGGIPPLVTLLRKSSTGTKRHASLTLAQLSRGDVPTALAITAQGAVTAFVEWLADSAYGPPEMAARALEYIAQDNKDTQTTIAEEGAIKLLIEMVEPSNPVEWQTYAAGALASLAEGHIINQVVTAEEGGVAPVVELLKRDAAGPHENATRAVWHLAAYIENKLSIAREGGLEPLVRLLHDGTPAAQEYAAAALEALTRDCESNQNAAAIRAGIEPLVNLMGSESEETQDHAVRALLNISLPNVENRNAVVRPLVAMLEVRNATAAMKAAYALVLLSGRSLADRVAVTEAGGVSPLVNMLGDGRNATIPQVHAAAVLSELSRTGENKAAIVSAGGVAPLVRMLSNRNEDAQMHAAGAVAHLTANTSAQKLIAELNGIFPLVNLLSAARETTARHAVGALYHLQASSDNKGIIVKTGAIPPLVKLLRRSEGHETQEAVASVLSDLSRHQSGGKAITLAGGIPSLVALLKTGSALAQKYAACALWGITSGTPGNAQWPQIEQNRATVTQSGAIPMLLTLLSSAEDVQHYAVATLNNLAHTEAARDLIREGNGIDLMMPIASNMTQSWLKTQANEMLQLMGVDMGESGPGGLSKLNMAGVGAEANDQATGRGTATASRRAPPPGLGSARPNVKFNGQVAGARQAVGR